MIRGQTGPKWPNEGIAGHPGTVSAIHFTSGDRGPKKCSELFRITHLGVQSEGFGAYFGMLRILLS